MLPVGLQTFAMGYSPSGAPSGIESQYLVEYPGTGLANKVHYGQRGVNPSLKVQKRCGKLQLEQPAPQPPPRFRSVDVVCRVVNVELAGRGDKPIAFYTVNLLKCLRVVNHYETLAVHGRPGRHPELGALFVEFDVHHARVLLRSARNFPAGLAVFDVILAERAQRRGALGQDAHGEVCQQPRAVVVCLDEQIAGVWHLKFANQLPGMLRMTVRVDSDYR